MIEPVAHKPLRWLHGEIRTPPFLLTSRLEAGRLLRQVQQGERLSLPHSRPMPSIGPRCHEPRVADASHAWRIVYRIDDDAILILDVFSKATQQTPTKVLDACRARCRRYDAAAAE